MTTSVRCLLFALLAGCADVPRGPVEPPAPAPAPFPPAPLARAERVPPAPDAPFEVRRPYELDGDVLVFPIEVEPAPNLDPRDPDRALALSALLVRALDVDPDLNPLGLALDAAGQPLPLEGVAASETRFLVGGRLRRVAGAPFELTLWLMDRETRTVASRTLKPDLPRLLAPRNALADLLAEVGRGPTELQRADMTWYEDLDLARLALAGEVVRAEHGVRDVTPEALDALIARADAEAPWSFLVATAVAEHLLPRESGCTAATVDRLSRVLTLHRELPFTLETYALSCVLGADLDANTPQMPAWSRQTGSHCRVGGKGLTSIASSRGRVNGKPALDTGFVTGLGGLYRGDTCDAGIAVMSHAKDDLGPPFVRAGLELEAAFYFYGRRDLDKSTAWFKRAQRTVEDARGTHCLVDLLGAEATLGLIDLAVEDGREEDTRALLPRAREVAERCQDGRMIGRLLNSEALLALGRSAFDRALDLLGRARAAFLEIGDSTNLAVVESNLGVTWLHLGRVDRAVSHFETALAGKRMVRSEGGIGVLLENLGVAELARGNGEAAAGHFAEALEHTIDAHTRATLNVQIARLQLARGDLVKAREHMDLARADALRAHSKVLDAVVEQTDAAVSVEAGEYQKALDEFHEALAIRREIGDRAGEGITLSLLMAISDRMGRPALAILYGKLAIAAHQDVRAAASAIDRDTAHEFLATRADTYRHLADLLVAEGRLVEAERVLALLKEDEVSRWTRDASQAAKTAVPLTTAESAIDKRYSEIADKIMQLGKEHGELAAKWPRSAKDEARLGRLRDAIEAANQRFSSFLANVTRQSQALASSKTLEDLREGTSIGPDLAELGPGYVAVYTLVSADHYHAIVVSPDAQVARTVDVGEGTLNALVATFRQALQDPTRDPRPAGQELYRLLIAPIEQDLEQAGAKTILWSLDRTLRYVPMAALYDGKRFALERWGMAVFTPASMARLKDLPQSAWRVLAMGVAAEHPPFPALPAVAEELAGLVDTPDSPAPRGVLPGLKVLDADFTRDALFAQLSRRWPVVHLASHFAFQPGDKDESFLLLGDGSHLTVGELERLPNLLQGVDLLTLSACDTATGDAVGSDGSEVESFAVLAQRKGARAVFASLWPVSDKSTSALMRRFYQLHGEAPNKLEALRRAQLELLQGAVASVPGTERSRPLTLPGPTAASPSAPAAPTAPPKPIDPALAGWRHPYYWAPFVLVGNVR